LTVKLISNLNIKKGLIIQPFFCASAFAIFQMRHLNHPFIANVATPITTPLTIAKSFVVMPAETSATMTTRRPVVVSFVHAIPYSTISLHLLAPNTLPAVAAIERRYNRFDT